MDEMLTMPPPGVRCINGTMARVMSLSFLVFLAVPILAPTVGQLILLVAPWRWIFGVLAVAPLAIYPVFLMEALTMALFAASFNLVFGYSGLLSFGHAAFYGVSAYATAFLVKDHGFSTELALLAAVAMSGALGALFGLLALKRRGIYFSMVTLALAEVVYFIALRWPATPPG